MTKEDAFVEGKSRPSQTKTGIVSRFWMRYLSRGNRNVTRKVARTHSRIKNASSDAA